MEFDVGRHIGAVTREVVSGERDGKETRVVVAGRSFSTDIGDAWDALTNAARIPRWFSPVSGELRLGGRYQIEGNAGGTILICEPPERLEVSWEFGGGTTWVRVTLSEAEPGRTDLRLEHIAYPDAEFVKFWDQFGAGAVGVGWDLSLLGLAEHLESGWDKPPETDTEWVKSENYRAFVAGSSIGWRDAAIASGEDAETAKGAAERTAASYTGTGEPAP